MPSAVTTGFLLMYLLENLILPCFALSHLGHALFFGIVVLGVVFTAGFGMLAHPH